MTKAEIVEQIYEQVGFSKKEAAELVERKKIRRLIRRLSKLLR